MKLKDELRTTERVVAVRDGETGRVIEDPQEIDVFLLRYNVWDAPCGTLIWTESEVHSPDDSGGLSELVSYPRNPS
jgi:hypothetical protein